MDNPYVLVVGGAGYIGAMVCRRLAKRSVSFVCLDNRLYGQAVPGREILGSAGAFIHGDVRDRSKLGNLISNASCIVWLAAIVGDGACDVNHTHTNEINLEPIRWLAQHYPDKKLVFASTASVYGHSSEAVHEDSPLEPLSLYAETKVRGEELIRNSMLNHTILRLGTAFGMRHYTRKRLDLAVQAITVDAIYNRRIRVFGKTRWRPFTHIDDIARCFVKAIHQEYLGTYNITLQNIQIGDLALRISELTGCENIQYSDIEYDRRDYRMNYDKAAQLGLIDSRNYTSLDFGVLETIEHVRQKDLDNPRLKNLEYLKSRTAV